MEERVGAPGWQRHGAGACFVSEIPGSTLMIYSCMLSIMILKEKDNITTKNKKIAAGNEAEREMAFYLNRAFGEDPRVFVFHDLRIERNGEAAQMDHLLLHKHGLVIIESKSVAGTVHVNEHLEFKYVRGRREEGMASPIQQAKRQGDLLRSFLQDQRESLRSKRLLGLIQGGFTHCPIDVLVAISDKSVIRRPKIDIPELHKADLIADRAQALIKRHADGAKLTSKVDGDWGLYSFTPSELDRVRELLLSSHSPFQRASRKTTSNNTDTKKPDRQKAAPRDVTAARSQTSERRPTYLCTHCQSTKLQILYGRSYYFKCSDCDGNTSIRDVCSDCGTGTRLKKRGNVFSAVCKGCNSERMFFENETVQD